MYRIRPRLRTHAHMNLILVVSMRIHQARTHDVHGENMIVCLVFHSRKRGHTQMKVEETVL